MNDPANSAPGNAHWYAVYCKHRHERAVRDRLVGLNLSAHVADYQARVRWGSRQRTTTKNLLPGYVLVHEEMTPAKYLRVLQAPGVVRFVGNPWPWLSWIPEDQMESIRLLLRSREEFADVSFWREGDQVEVLAGPLAGLRGYYGGSAGRWASVVVSVDLLQRSVSVRVNPADLRLVSRRLAVA